MDSKLKISLIDICWFQYQTNMFFLPSEEDLVSQDTLQLCRLLYNAVCSM